MNEKEDLLRPDETDDAPDAFITCECGPRDYHSSAMVYRLRERLEDARRELMAHKKESEEASHIAFIRAHNLAEDT